MRWIQLRPILGQLKNTSRVSFDGANTFNFNNEARVFSGNWNDSQARKLWLYNLHYMTWIFDLESGREDWIRRWIRENPNTKGGNGWEPYPLSLRLFNWCKHFSITGTTPDTEILESMGLQAAHLLENLEFHLDGNHLLENLFALGFVGLFLDTQEIPAVKAVARISALLEAELSHQFLDDGGHFELSPMYHSILLERILDLLNIWPLESHFTMDAKVTLKLRANRGLDWLDVMSVGGRFSLFNDSCYDAAPEAGMLIDYGSRLLGRQSFTSQPLRSLAVSGYYRAEAGAFTMIFDGGNLGPDHQMGHAQGDMLSACLWFRGTPILVHPGNFEYLPGAMRDYCRSTSAHNTLVVSSREQAEWWSSHRVGWRGYSKDVSALVRPDGSVRLEGSHTGFIRLIGSPIHCRMLELSAEGLSITDTVSGSHIHHSRVYFHFHPDCSVEQEKNTIKIRSVAGNLILSTDCPLKLEEGWHCPEFGLRFRNPVVVAEFNGSSCRSRLSVSK